MNAADGVFSYCLIKDEKNSKCMLCLGNLNLLLVVKSSGFYCHVCDIHSIQCFTMEPNGATIKIQYKKTSGTGYIKWTLKVDHV